MSLTGSAFLITLVLLTGAAFVAAVVFLPRWPGLRPARLVARAAALLLVNSLVLVTALVAFNDNFGFFADWTDLHTAIFGGTTASTTTLAGGSAAAAAAPLSGPTTKAAFWARLLRGDTEGQHIVSFQVPGRSSGLTGTVVVSLPPGYGAAANAHRRYPVLEAFSGYPAAPSQIYDYTALLPQLRKMADAHRIAPVVTISPQIEFPDGTDTECVNGAGHSEQVETWLTKDVPDWAMHEFRLDPSRSAWASIGISAGAWCAAMVTMLHPQQYAAAIVLAGYFSPEFEDSYRPWSSTSPQARRYDLVALAHRDPPRVALWVQTSVADSVSYRPTMAMLKAARAPLAVQAVVLHHAGHRFGVWDRQLPVAFRWLAANVPGFTPQ